MEVAPRIRKVKIINNKGVINFGNRHCISPFSVSKAYNGSGGASEGSIVNGQRMETEGLEEEQLTEAIELNRPIQE